MGRSSAEQAALNREKIVATAARLFRERGVDKVSVAEIMTAVGMTVGGFYKQFDSKDALVQEACALSFQQALRNWDSAAEAGVMGLVQHYFRDRPADHTCPMLAFGPVLSADDAPPPVRDTYRQGASDLLDLFREAGHDPARRKVDESADILFMAMIGAKLLAQATADSDWSKILIDKVTRAAAESCY